MGWSIGYDVNWERDIGYGVPAVCDHPNCKKKIDRGLSYVCGGEPYGEPDGCGLFFCSKHLYFSDKKENQVCERCLRNKEPFEPKKDIKEWVDYKLTDKSWAKWRKENRELVERMKG